MGKHYKKSDNNLADLKGVMEVAKRRVSVGVRWKATHQTNIRSVYKILRI